MNGILLVVHGIMQVYGIIYSDYINKYYKISMICNSKNIDIKDKICQLYLFQYKFKTIFITQV